MYTIKPFYLGFLFKSITERIFLQTGENNDNI